MAAATPTSYTDKIVYTDEVAEFSPVKVDGQPVKVNGVIAYNFVP